MKIRKRFSASSFQNQDFISIQTCSWASFDPKGQDIYLETDVNDDALGQAVLDALAASRWWVLSEEEGDELGHPDNIKRRYEAWKETLMKRYGYKTKQSLFKKMMHVSIESCDGQIAIHPNHHEKLEAWSGTINYPDDHVIIPANSSPAEIGAALRLAFSRCTSKFE